jgi:DNA-binding HxlR family transcriptional regulator
VVFSATQMIRRQQYVLVSPVTCGHARTAFPKRYAELPGETQGISEKTLTQTQRSLERDGLVSRKVYRTVPPKVWYTLTELRLLIFPLKEMCAWTDRGDVRVDRRAHR